MSISFLINVLVTTVVFLLLWGLRRVVSQRQSLMKEAWRSNDADREACRKDIETTLHLQAALAGELPRLTREKMEQAEQQQRWNDGLCPRCCCKLRADGKFCIRCGKVVPPEYRPNMHTVDRNFDLED